MKTQLLILSCVMFLPYHVTIAQSSHEEPRVPVIELSGEGYERGLQHGTQLKSNIQDVFAKWKLNIHLTTKGDPDSVLTAFRNATNFEPTIRNYTPVLIDEMKGIAAGSDQSYEDVYAFQLLDEFWVYLDKQSNSSENHHCSGIGVAGNANHPAYLAQNMDLENYMHGYQTLFHLAATNDEPEQYVISCAGLIALAGMNSNGIGLCMNTLMELQSSEDGLPVAFIVRGVLSKQTGQEALEFLKTVKHASGQNYILGIVDSVYNFEASSNEVVRFIPASGDGSVVYHTNHALANHDVKPWYQKYHQQVMAGETQSRNSEMRFASLERRLGTHAVNVSVDLVKSTLRSKDDFNNPVCRTFRVGGRGFTFSSLVFTLGGKRSVQVTFGSPDESEYVKYFLESEEKQKVIPPLRSE